MGAKRTVTRIIRLTEEENEAIEELAMKHRKTFSAYMRESALNRNEYFFPQEMMDLIEELIRQTRMIGININQIVKFCNAQGDVTKIDYERLLDLLHLIEKKVSSVIAEIRGRVS